MNHWNAEAERRRLKNIGLAERSVRRALRRHLVRDYLPGQVTYNLGNPLRAPLRAVRGG